MGFVLSIQGRAAQTRQIISMLDSLLERTWLVCLVLFFVAFAPRVAAAGAYVTVDEEHWVARSVDFVYNLGSGNLEVMPSVHPGVTGLWGFGLSLFARSWLTGDVAGLLEMHANDYYDLPDLLPTAAMFTTLVTSLTVVGGYLLLRNLWGKKGAFLAGLLIALDPYFLAHSRRVHLDAILSSTMYLSALALLVWVGWSSGSRPRRYLVISGIFAGLAWLTKVTAIYLIPFTLLALAGHLFVSSKGCRVGIPALARIGKSLLLWVVVAGLIFWVPWPAMWVKPGLTIGELIQGIMWGVEVPHGAPASTGNMPMHFFLGQVVDDPGLGYYPLISLFRMSPITFLFLPASLVAIVAGQRRKAVHKSRALAFWLGVAYIVFYIIMISLGAKKLESYMLPIFPMADTLAAVGLLACLRWLARRWQRWRRGARQPATHAIFYGLAVAGIIAVSFLWLRLVPYYSAYFNPLLGGAKQASRWYAFGGGEGLDMAARYLNGKEGAEDLVVSTPYDDAVFQYYFKGKAEPLRRKHWTGSWLLADYVILYFSYVQRNVPSPEVVDFINTLEPEYVASINGIEYAKVYQVPALITDHIPPISHPADVNLGDEVTFLGYDLASQEVESSGEIEITLYWQRRRPLDTDYSVYVRLVNGVRHVWGAQDSGPLWGTMPTSFWQEGMVVADRRRLQVLPGTPPGIYEIEIGMYDSATMYHLEPIGVEGELVLGPITIERGIVGGLPGLQHTLEANLDDQVHLVGYDLEGRLEPGGSLHLTLYWQAVSSPATDYTVFVHLIGEDGQIWSQQDNQPVTGYYPTSLWMEGELVRDQYDLPVPDEAPTGKYTLRVGMYEAGTDRRLPLLDEKGAIVADNIVLDAVQVDVP